LTKPQLSVGPNKKILQHGIIGPVKQCENLGSIF